MSPIRRAVLVTHSHPEQTGAALGAALGAAELAGVELFAAPGEHAKHPGILEGVPAYEKDGELPDLCLVLGGDGSILQSLRRFSGTGVPVFAVNFGTIGFLAATERTELAAGLDTALAGGFEVMSLPGLELGLDVEMPIGLNDVTFIRKPHGRVAELAYSLDGDELGHVRCDGLVAATPAGSTGYNLANSGPILAWGVQGYVVSFIAPHTLTARALVAAPGDVLIVSNARGREAVDVALDGAPAGELPSGDKVEIRFREGAASLALMPGSSFYRRMREKFGRLAR